MYKIFTKSSILLLTSFIMSMTQFPLFAQGQAQVDIWELMKRRDLRLSEIDAIANEHFNRIGKVRGTGYKQFERWKYEKQFHLDNNGFILPDDYDANQYNLFNGLGPSPSALSGAWTELGPFNWTRTTSWNPGVGRITAISVYPLNNNIIYVTSPGGGIWKSLSGGNQWVPLNDQNNAMMDLFSVAVDPTNQLIVFTGSSAGNLFRSLDGGTSWTTQNTGMGNVRKILFDPTNSQVIYAVGSGIFKSTNGGSSWTKVLTANIEDIEFQPGNTSILYASGSDVYRSGNAGIGWTQIGVANGITTSARVILGVSPADPQTVYAIQANGSEFGRLYRSTDGGNNYVTTITGSPGTCTNFFGYESSGCGTGGQAWYDMAITVNPLNANEVHIAGIIGWKSTNGGISFSPETEWSLPNTVGYNHADIHALEWVGSVIYSGSDGGIYKSIDNGNNWTDLSNSLGIRQFYRIASSKTDAALVTGGAQDNGSGILKTSGWIDYLGADGMDCLVSPINSSLIWGTSQYGSLYRTSNGGSSYSGISEPATGNWVTPLAIESNTNTIYAGWNGVYKSTDLGVSWENLSVGTINSNLSVLAVAPSNAAYIYASNNANLYVTKNGGTSWSTIPMTVSITSIAIHPTNPDKIWITSSSTINRVLVSTNAGTSFTNISGNLPSIAARSIVVDNTADEGIYAAMNLGVYYLNKNTTSWTNLSDNLPLVAVNEVELQIASGKLRVGTYGRGLWERDVLSTCGIPISLNTTNISNNSATINWAALSGASNYDVDYKLNSSSTWINAATATTALSANLSGLNASSLYDWRVRANCGGTLGNYAQAQLTTTVSQTCGTVANLASSAITTSSATVGWNSLAGASSYDVDYKISTSLTWINAVTFTTSLSANLSSLTAGSLYHWRVRANCTETTGEYFQSQFTTSSPVSACPGPLDISTNGTYTGSATIPLNTDIKGTVSVKSDNDYYKFIITTGGTISLSLTTLPANYNLALLNSNGKQITISQKTGTTSESISTTVVAGTYYARVFPKGTTDFNATLCYTLKVATGTAARIGIESADEEEIGKKNIVTIYPNPAGENLFVNINNLKSTAELNIYSISGKLVLKQQTNEPITEVNISKLNQGMYILNVKDGNNFHNLKFIKE